MNMIEVPLHAVAHARAGDKGNRSNISVIPYLADAFALLVEQVTEERMLAVCKREKVNVWHAWTAWKKFSWRLPMQPVRTMWPMRCMPWHF